MDLIFIYIDTTMLLQSQSATVNTCYFSFISFSVSNKSCRSQHGTGLHYVMYQLDSLHLVPVYLCVYPKFKFLNHLVDFRGNPYERHATESHTNPVHFNRLNWVIITRRSRQRVWMVNLCDCHMSLSL
jgi:hypothetical protein